ncbi:MAG: PIN domain-containing protein [Flavobacterium sp.]|nr:PIN domain-containing protein [Flavobacterium sp.]
MHKKKNQRPTTNHVAQKQVDTSQTKKPNLNQVLPIPQKKDDKNQTRNIIQFMAKKSTEYIDALVFIDTNILLDFYRIRKSNISMKYLEEIEKHKELIIITSQVEMEFNVNRQQKMY